MHVFIHVVDTFTVTVLLTRRYDVSRTARHNMSEISCPRYDDVFPHDSLIKAD